MTKKATGGVTPVGKKIRKIRMDKNISLDMVANDTGLSLDYLKKLEAGKVIPPVGALLQLARSLQIDSGMLLKEEEENLNERIRAYAKRTDNYAYETLTPGAENKHLKAFRVTIEPHQDHSGVDYQHEGEEFNYVLAGQLEVTVGDHVNVLNAHDSLHFNSGIQHHLRNIGDEPVELLVVIYGP